MMNTTKILLAAALAVVLSMGATGADAATKRKKSTAPDRFEQEVMQTPSFLAAHPDLNYRIRGWEALKAGKHKDAMTFLRRAARHADKPSQALIAEMYFDGNGVPQDRAIAYAWMDIAAERGYENFLVLRERYWNVLDEAQRADAIGRGAALYAEYGDVAAQPRIANVLRRERARQTGSRTGFTGNLKVLVPGPNGVAQEIDGSKFYASKFWDPKEYRAWHDAIWMKPLVGRVDVGDLEPVRADTPANGAPETTRDDGVP